jgi:hypothetical protein
MVSRSLRFGVTLVGVVGLVSIAGCPGGGGGDGEVTGAEGGGSGEVGTDSQGDGDGDGEETGGGGTQACDDDADCPLPNYGCFDPPDGECACLPGFVLCGEDCVDIRNDPLNCGACGNVCDPAQCGTGRCASEPAPTPGSVTAMMSGGDPTLECIQNNEAKPDRSINGPPGLADRFVAYQRIDAMGSLSPHNWTLNEQNEWSDGVHTLPPGQGSELNDASNDPWSATHGGTGLEYISYIGGIDLMSSCTAVAATDRASMPGGAWLGGGFFCLGEPIGELRDGPVLVSDLGATALYTADTIVPGSCQAV